MIYFVGGGPGDPEMITLKGYRLLQDADLVVYAGSLVNPEILKFAGPGARLVNSASMDLNEIISCMVEAHSREEKVVRLHTGDASIYGAIGEQMAEVNRRGIPYAVVPGISSFLAAAARLQKEYTVPGETQTLVITRLEGRTPVPHSEDLESLACHGASMVIFLSAGMVDKVRQKLLRGYSPETPVAVVYKVSWPEEKVIQGTLDNLDRITREAGITKTALILVGDFLQKTSRSKLYDREFSHGYRVGKNED